MKIVNKRGFSILEVLVSLAVLGIAIVFLGSTLPFGMMATQKITASTQAVFLAQARMEELASAPYDELVVDEVNEQSLENINPDFEKFSRETKIDYLDQDLNIVGEDEGLKKIEVIVSWRDPLRKIVTQTTLTSLRADF